MSERTDGRTKTPHRRRRSRRSRRRAKGGGRRRPSSSPGGGSPARAGKGPATDRRCGRSRSPPPLSSSFGSRAEPSPLRGSPLILSPHRRRQPVSSLARGARCRRSVGRRACIPASSETGPSRRRRRPRLCRPLVATGFCVRILAYDARARSLARSHPPNPLGGVDAVVFVAVIIIGASGAAVKVA